MSVSLYADKNKLHLEITDDGVGFDWTKFMRKGKSKDWHTRDEGTG